MFDVAPHYHLLRLHPVGLLQELRNRMERTLDAAMTFGVDGAAFRWMRIDLANINAELARRL